MTDPNNSPMIVFSTSERFLNKWGVGTDLFLGAIRDGDQCIALIARDGLTDEQATNNAERIVAALSARPLPSDWAAVPREPTGEMFDAVELYFDGAPRVSPFAQFRKAWNTMLAAAPSAPAEAVQTAPEPLAQGHAASCLSGKYGDVLRPFVIAMDRELHANAGKGDRPGWLAMRPEIALLEIYYHLSKLQKAVKDDNGPGIQEYAADVANMSMMLLDICGGLGLIEYASPQPAAEGGRVCKWHQQDEGYDTFSTGCGHEYTVNECTDGNVQLPYCPFCAKPLRGIAWAEDDDISLPEAIEPNPPQPSASVVDNSICSPVSPEEEEAIDLAAGIAKVVLRLPIDLLGAIDHKASQQGVVRNAYLREHLAVTHSDASALTTAAGGGA